MCLLQETIMVFSGLIAQQDFKEVLDRLLSHRKFAMESKKQELLWRYPAVLDDSFVQALKTNAIAVLSSNDQKTANPCLSVKNGLSRLCWSPWKSSAPGCKSIAEGYGEFTVAAGSVSLGSKINLSGTSQINRIWPFLYTRLPSG